MSQIGLLGAFLGGLLALLSPCSALLLPSFFAYAFDGAGKLAGRTGIFYLGLAAVLVPLGAGVGAIGSAITRYREVTTMIGGVVIIALGVMIIVGRGFALGSAQRAAARIGVLMALYAAGMVIPLFVLALVWDRFSLGSRTWLRGKEISIGPLKTHTTSLISGVLFIGIGVLFLLTEGTANLGGVMGVDSQYSLQVWISDVADAVPNTAVLLIAVLMIIAVLTVRIVRGRGRDTAAESSELGERENRTP